MIADALEAVNSIEMTVAILNDYRVEHQLDLYGYSAVYSCYKRMKPRVISFKKRQQGIFHPKSDWAIARVMVILQVLLRQEEITMNDSLPNQFRDTDGRITTVFPEANFTIN